ncbi:energy transducer TonB [Terriglobus sp. 2YAB30_2]|uniref:energy transducer TonB n=1 Tax=unclassified Terriglobus TaxID=2628988 RepID=UPI003F9C074C
MKKLIAASIALVSVAANAQLMPITDGFLARAIAPAAIASATGVAKPVNAAIALVPPVRQSQLDASKIAAGAAGLVTVHFTVDTNGIPQDITLDRSISSSVDARIIQAVSALRYTPGSLHGEKIAYPVALSLDLK